MLSTHDPADFREQALAAGAFDFMSKSTFDPIVLADAWEPPGPTPRFRRPAASG